MSKHSDHMNSVFLVGRMSSPMEVRELPSGDKLGIFRLVVERDDQPEASSAKRSRRMFDVLDCVVWAAEARCLIEDWVRGDIVEITGSLRRRFWKDGESSASRYEVAVDGARRLAKAAAA